MRTKLQKVLFTLLIIVVGCNIANAQQLERAFNSVLNIEGFELLPYTTEEYGYPKEMGTMKMIGYGNSDPREQVLKLLSIIPNELMKVNYIDEKDKITRIYIENDNRGQAVFMQVFIGKGGNDLCLWLFTGASLEYYKQIAIQINNDLTSA